MSGEKSAGSCNKFLANIFNKSKCQNCFKSRELHLLSEHDEEQAKPIYGGWLCLAPEGTDFDNRMQRSRKWQRRFFILYEHGRLSYALDELPSTLPQGTVNMNLCTDITDAEPRTGQRNALCVVMSEQEIFIRGDNKEIINGWSEQLATYLHTNKKNLRKKHKMEPVANQEPSPAKMAATGQAELDCDWRQEEQRARKADVTPICTVTDTDPPGLEQSPAGNTSAYLCLMSSNSLTLDSNSSFEGPVSDLAASRSGDTGSSKQLAEPNIIQTTVKQSQEGSTADEILGLEATKKEQVGWAAASRTGRSDARSDKREKLKSCGGQLSPPPPQRRATSLDRRTSDTVMTPDLLNVKKGWLVKLDENDQWKKYWFVLSTDSLRYYKDSITEEASDLEGEINLMRCYNVSEYQVQRNYGFQIHTPKAIYTLSAMTAGIRKNWIHSLMKNIHPVNAPDVASSNMPQPDHIPPHHVQLPKVQGYSVCTDRKTKGRKPLSLKKRRNLSSHHVLCGPPDAFPKPDVTQDSSSTDISIDRDGHTKPSGVMERRCEGSYKTFDWTEFRLQNKPKADIDPPRTKSPCLLELGDLERRQRWEERRRKYESMLGFSLSWEESINKTKDVGVRAQNPRSQHEVEEEIEECWRQVEKTVFILERTVPLLTEAKDTVEMEPLLDNYRKEVEDLKVQLAKSEQNRLELQSQLHPTGRQQQQQQQQLTSLDPPLGSEADFHTSDTNEKSSNQSQTQNLKDLYVPTGENVLREEQLSLEPSSSTAQMLVWLQNMHSSFQELGECQHNLPDSNDHIIRLNSDGSTTNHQKQLDRDDSQLFPTSETQMSNIEYKSDSLLLEKAAEGDHCSVSYLMEQHVHSDCAIVRRLSREVELLTSHNEALNQRNQEMLNQLTEADHEIEKLKAKFSSRYTIKPRHLAEVEQKGKMEAKELEQKLSLRTEELLAAQTLVTSLEENLRESETLLQLSVPTGRAETAESKSDCRADGCLLWSFEATEAKLTELERQPQQYEINCRELQAQNSELKDAEKLYCQRIAETVAEIRRLKEESDQERINKEQICSSGEKEIQQVIERMVMRLEALGKLLEMMDKLDLVRESEHKDKTHAEIWSLLLKELQARTSDEEKSVEVLLNKVTEHKMLEREMLLLGHNLCSVIDACTDEGRENLKDPDCVWNTTSVTVTESDMFDFNHQLCNIEHFRVMTQKKIALLKRIGSSLSPPFLEKLQAIADRLKSFHISENPQFGFMDSAAIEALCCCQLSLVQSKWEKEVEETKQKSLHCSNCIRLMEQNKELKAKLSKLEQAKKNVWCQTDESYLQEESSSGTVRENNLQQDPKTPEEQIVESSLNHMEISPSQFQQDENSDESQLETNLKLEMEQILVLRERVKELDELLSLTVEEMKEEFDENLSSVQMQHEMEMEKLKVACQRGFGSMEECHRKVVGGLQHRHQQEVEHILVERDQLLEEERAATVAAITAIKNAHRLELEREVESQPGCRQPENRNTILDEILRQHNEELASYQQELEVLSQQFSLKCLENGHLVQSLDAERKALCQCQQEIQDLRTRNQELSSHLVAEITRLCTLTEQGGPSLSQGMDIYEMEIALRVKEFEVQCLQQEITSLKDQLQFAQQDKRDATKKYKDMYMEMSIVRVKTERQMDELRENLRLAHQALEQTSL